MTLSSISLSQGPRSEEWPRFGWEKKKKGGRGKGSRQLESIRIPKWGPRGCWAQQLVDALSSW